MKSCFSEKERGKVWKDYMEQIMKENMIGIIMWREKQWKVQWSVLPEEVLQELNELKTGKAPGPFEVSLEFIVAIGGVGIQVMAEICQKVLDGFEMPVEWALSIVVPIFMGKGDIRNYSCHRAAQILEHGMKVL